MDSTCGIYGVATETICFSSDAQLRDKSGLCQMFRCRGLAFPLTLFIATFNILLR